MRHVDIAQIRRRLKPVGVHLLARVGITRARAKRVGPRVIVLMLHRVLPKEQLVSSCSSEHIMVSVETLDAMLEVLAGWGDALRLEDIVTQPCEANGFLVTFDDGWSDTVTYAHPLLKKRGIPYVVFLPPGLVGEHTVFWQERVRHFCMHVLRGEESVLHGLPGGAQPDALAVRAAGCTRPAIHRWIEQLKQGPQAQRDAVLMAVDEIMAATPCPVDQHRLMTWDEARCLQAGGVQFGAHGHTHQLLTQLTPDETRDELDRARIELCRQLGSDACALAYPNGSVNDQVARMAQEVGYTLGFTTREGAIKHPLDPMQLPRLNVCEHRFVDAYGTFDPMLLHHALAWA